MTENTNKKQRLHWQKSIFITILLILLMTGASFIVVHRLNQMEEEKSFETLRTETSRLAGQIELLASFDREQLEILAQVVSDYYASDYYSLSSQALWNILDSYQNVGMISRIEILLPDGTILTSGGRAVDAGASISFAEAAAQGSHISDRVTDLAGDGSYVLRHYVPVTQDGQVIAMLYGIIRLNSLPDQLTALFQERDASIYIIDSLTGDLLMDTWHQELGNFWELGERPMAPGYNHEQLKEDLTNGKNGYVVFTSNTTGEYLYFYFEPMNINHWQIALSVPEDVVFADANDIRFLLNIFLAFEICCFVLYLLWMLQYVRSETRQKQRQLDSINYIYEVEKLLFNAHEEKDNLLAALKKTAQLTSAQRIFLWILGESGSNVSFRWEYDRPELIQESEPLHWEYNKQLLDYFRQGHNQLELYNSHDLSEFFPTRLPGEIFSLMAIPIRDGNDRICAVLAACNIEEQANPTMLRSLNLSFSMFCRNMLTYQAIKERGEKDLLSGLYNRNRYEMDLPSYLGRYHSSLSCIYVDINGLHEMNNSQGHEAGDRMIQQVARQLSACFGPRHSYRTGGDEFLAFAVDMDEETVYALGKSMKDTLEKQEIYISIGIEWEEEVSSMESLVKKAEAKMYQEKKAFYANEKYDRRNRRET